jgi:hypothetical protein
LKLATAAANVVALHVDKVVLAFSVVALACRTAALAVVLPTTTTIARSNVVEAR